MPLKKNDDIRLIIDGYTAEGNGVGHYENMAIFVNGAAAGDLTEAHIIKVKSNYAIATVKRVITPSSDRVEPDCGVFARCGGCSFRHIAYESECRLKRQRVDDAFERIGKLPLRVGCFIPCENTDGYRNKALLPVGRDASGGIAAGFFSQKSHRIIPCDECRLHPPIFNEAAAIFKNWAQKYSLSAYDEATATGLLRHLYIRYADMTGQLMVCPVINADTLPYSRELVRELQALDGLTSVMFNVNQKETNVVLGKKCVCVYGEEYIEDSLCSLRVRISPLSFYQINRAQAQLLYEKAAEFAGLNGDETLLDLYCGAGTIGLSMAKNVRKLIGVEIIPEAIEDARLNARLNGIENARFICADAAQAAAELKRDGTRPDVVVLDPPRKGCAPELISTVVDMSPGRIVYISCDPATLARDCAVFAGLGYEAKQLCAVDMFPRTAHVECVTLLENVTNSGFSR